MENSRIEWTDHTFNPWWGCMKVSEGCKNCYAETLDNRYHHADPHWGPNSARKQMSDKHWMQPFIWDEKAFKSGIKAKVFCASMADVFEDNDDLVVVYGRRRLFNIIENTPNLIWQLLTKRPENIMKFIPLHWASSLPNNVWIGTSVENQDAAENRIPELLNVPARVRFLSCEPLLGPVDLSAIWVKCHNCDGSASVPVEGGGVSCPVCLTPYQGTVPGINWVICGGESGPGARPMHPDWARSLRDECKVARIPFFFKQWGNWHESDLDEGKGIGIERRHLFPGGKLMYNLGNKKTGALLDGKEWKGFPEC